MVTCHIDAGTALTRCWNCVGHSCNHGDHDQPDAGPWTMVTTVSINGEASQAGGRMRGVGNGELLGWNGASAYAATA